MKQRVVARGGACVGVQEWVENGDSEQGKRRVKEAVLDLNRRLRQELATPATIHFYTTQVWCADCTCMSLPPGCAKPLPKRRPSIQLSILWPPLLPCARLMNACVSRAHVPRLQFVVE